MATLPCMKRMRKERDRIEKEASDEWFVSFKDDNLLDFTAYIVGPEDSLYRHKFIKVHFQIPPNYPMVPPKVKHVQHSGGRIHPNLYVEGKICLSILGTWAGEPWAVAMTVTSGKSILTAVYECSHANSNSSPRHYPLSIRQQALSS